MSSRGLPSDFDHDTGSDRGVRRGGFGGLGAPMGESDGFGTDGFGSDGFGTDLDLAPFEPFASEPHHADGFTPQSFALDAFTPDAFTPDAFTPDAFTPDAFTPDAFTPDAFTPDAFSPDGFSPSAFAPDGPTRWDALDATAGSDRGSLRNADQRSRGAVASEFEQGGFLVPLDTVAPVPTVADDAYRICYRLTGSPALAAALSADAVASPSTVGESTGSVFAVIATAVRSVLARCDAEAAAGTPDLVAVQEATHAQHRLRLRRELGRRTERDQVILALRHLAVVPPVAVAARLGIHESVIREVSTAWSPEDGRGDSSALLRGIDSWISSDLSSAQGSSVDHLAHLDDPARF